MLKIFGIKILELNTKYNERSSEQELEEDDFYIELHEVDNETRD